MKITSKVRNGNKRKVHSQRTNLKESAQFLAKSEVQFVHEKFSLSSVDGTKLFKSQSAVTRICLAITIRPAITGNPKSLNLAKFSFFLRGGGGNPDQLKSKSNPIFIFGGGVGWRSREGRGPILLKYLSGGTQGIFHQKFWKTSLLLHRR